MKRASERAKTGRFGLGFSLVSQRGEGRKKAILVGSHAAGIIGGEFLVGCCGLAEQSVVKFLPRRPDEE